MTTILDQLAAQASGADASTSERVAQELEIIRARFKQAAEDLDGARFSSPDGKGREVEELPWYVIIGAPGSGKTTALLNSGLRLPLYTGTDATPSVSGVGGTRNCDWWFTDEAVLLDTAGRYTTQESDRKADAAAWLGFLGLLKQFRPKRPINGALVTVSVMDLLLWTKAERAKYAAHVRMRLSEMVAALESRFPVYVLVTKVDMLAGFTDFFGDLDVAGRSQVWGTTFPMDIDPALIAGPYEKDFGALEDRLGAEMLARLHEERDLQRRASIYRFPQQFHSMGALMGEFLALAFGTQVNHKPLWLRGAYYSSGTQEGNPIDRVLVALARSFKLERASVAGPAGTGKSFFLTRLLREVVFSEADLAVADAPSAAPAS
jgi:type VI secretion system protein ImpL